MIVCVATLWAGPEAFAGENGEPDRGSIGFTFDDGPQPTWTRVVLDVLDRYGIKATFFVQGWRVERYPELAREIVSRGHSIQVHGFSHTAFTRLTDVDLVAELRRTSDAIFEATGLRPTCVRPPYGAANDRVRRVIAEFGLKTVIWDVNSVDYSTRSASQVLHQVLRRTEPGDDILGHDTLGWIWRDALPGLIAEFSARGVGFDTICENYDPALGPEGMAAHDGSVGGPRSVGSRVGPGRDRGWRVAAGAERSRVSHR